MEPRIQYSMTSDGVSIAHSVLDEGEPMVHMPWFPTRHLQMEWQMPEIPLGYERLAGKRFILAANVHRELAAGKGFLFSDEGDVVLRGFEDPVQLYEVRWREAG